MGPDSLHELLTGPGQTLLGVIVGGLIVVIGQWANARATRAAATRLELALKTTELLFDRR